MTGHAYPIRDHPTPDPRFTDGLVAEVAVVVERHGYPPVTGMDLLELRQWLHRFLYEEW